MTSSRTTHIPAPPSTPPERGSRRVRWLLIGAPVLIVAIVLGFAAVIIARAHHSDYQPSTPDYGSVPAYTLVDQNGTQVKSSEFAGKVQVLSFLFPYCTTYCPIEAHTLDALRHDLADAHLTSSTAIVSFNVDPENTGPAQMRAFLKEYGDDPSDPAWRYLTGTPAQIRNVVTNGLHIYYSKVSVADEQKEIAKEKAQGIYTALPEQRNSLADRAKVDYDVVHNDYLEIVDSNGKIVRMYDDPTKVTEAQLFADVRNLVENGHL